jgi:hypothetical protein
LHKWLVNSSCRGSLEGRLFFFCCDRVGGNVARRGSLCSAGSGGCCSWWIGHFHINGTVAGSWRVRRSGAGIGGRVASIGRREGGRVAGIGRREGGRVARVGRRVAARGRGRPPVSLVVHWWGPSGCMGCSNSLGVGVEDMLTILGLWRDIWL